jgi:hypothetical protein
MVYAELQENMQKLHALPLQQIRDFGIDDTNSYSANEEKVVGYRSVEGW